MKTPDREACWRIVWLTCGLLSCGSQVMPAALVAALREYKAALLAQSAAERWARPRYRARYGRLADRIAAEITGGTWEPGRRMPRADWLAACYGEQPVTAERALFVLAVRGHLALEDQSYYVMPPDTANRPAVLPPAQQGPQVSQWRRLDAYTPAQATEALDMRKCACGEEFQTSHDLRAHHAEHLTPGAIVGKDGNYHAEIFKDCPIPEYPYI